MEKLIAFFARRSLLINLLSVLIIIVGIISVVFIHKEVFPNVEFDVLLVTTNYPRSSTEDVEKLVTIPIERQIHTVEGIEEMDALSLEGRSIFYLKIDPDYKLKDVLDDVTDAVNSVDDLPEDSKVPLVKKIEHRAQLFIKVAVSADDQILLNQRAKEIRDELERVDGVSQVLMDGYENPEIRIIVDWKKLNQYQLTLGDVHDGIADRNFSLSAGTIKTHGRNLSLRTVGEFQNLDEIRNIVIRSNSSGQRIKLKQIAQVVETLSDSKIYHRANGKKAIYFSIKKRPSTDILAVTKLLKKKVKEIQQKDRHLPFSFDYIDDLSFFVKRRLGILTQNGIQGLILVFLCLCLFLNFKVALVTSFGAPLAFMCAFIFMDYFGITLNLISMFGLILVLGMLVDDAIIVAEYYYQLIEQGNEPFDAAVKASVRTIKPVTATVITTIFAFGSLFFMGGIMGKFLWSVPAVVILCLVASLFECFFILPAHLADFGKVSPDKLNKARWYDRPISFYKKILRKILDYYHLTIIGFIMLLIGALFIGKQMRFELFPGDDARLITMKIKGPVGLSIYDTKQAVEKIENIILKNVKQGVELEHLRTIVGQEMNPFGNRSGEHYGTALIYLTLPIDRTRTTNQILKDITKKAQKALIGFNVTAEVRAGGPPKGKPVDIEIRGDDLQQLIPLSQKIESILKNHSGITSTEIDYEIGKEQIIFDVNEDEAKRMGLTTKQIALELRKALAEDSISEIRRSDEDIEIKIFLDEEIKNDLSKLKNLYITNRSGRRIALNKIVTLKQEASSFVIRRFDRKRTISISASIDKNKTSPVKIAAEMEERLKPLQIEYPNIEFVFGGENKDTIDSMKRLAKSALIALFCIFLILVAMFGSLLQSLIIMVTIPFGLIGVILTFKILGLALGFMAMMGVVGLVGVVVNDSIVLVNFINTHLEKGKNIKWAIQQAAGSRFRAVILTTVTTVCGLLPVAHAKAGDPFLKPMALSFAYGLLFSTVVTLVLVPCSYLFIYRIKNFRENWEIIEKL